MKIEIVAPPHPDLPSKQQLDLLHEGFKERLNQNINFGCATYTLEQYRENTKMSFLFIASDEFENPIGMITLTPKNKMGLCFGHVENVVVSPQIKRSGAMTKLCSELIIVAKKKGMSFLTSTTATTATSSVKWHERNGFVKLRKLKFKNKNYTSYYFVMPLKWNLLTIIIEISRRPIYFISSLICK